MAAFNLKEAITEALSSLGGSGSAAEVREYIKSKFGRDWKTIEKVMDDMSVESESSFFLPEERVLKRMGQGKYALKEAAIQEPGEEIATEEPKTAPTGAIKSTLEEPSPRILINLHRFWRNQHTTSYKPRPNRSQPNQESTWFTTTRQTSYFMLEEQETSGQVSFSNINVATLKAASSERRWARIWTWTMKQKSQIS